MLWVSTCGRRIETSRKVSAKQRKAVEAILGTADLAVVLRGCAGTGKTHTVANVIEGMATIKREVVCFAPSTQAVDILRREGEEQARAGRKAAGAALQQAQIVQPLFVDPAVQKSIAFKAIVIDE
jgi:hypothetical protein